MKRLFFAFYFFVFPLLIFAQETPDAGGNLDIKNSDSQIYNMSIDLKIQDGASAQVVSDHKAQHQTVSGRPVTLNINGGNFKAAVRFFVYPIIADNLMLVAQSTIVFMKEGHQRLLSSAKSIPIKAGEKVLFFPMGAFNDGEKSGYKCKLEMEISKYQQPGTQE